MKTYNHKKIERKWQKFWEKNDFFQAADKSAKPKYYCLIEFPYPSGDGLHVGHVRSYTALDIMARKKRLQGFNVLYPIGWDAFGLPTENFAIKTGKHPTVITKENIKVFKKQMKDLGISFDWSREINTTDPEYYKWTQWIFLQLFKKGLAYKKKMPINWCPKCKIGLANEEVIDGECERCHTTAEKKELEQWMLKITAYADRLIDDLETVDYLEKIKTQQINWIGRSEGAEVDFKIKGTDKSARVFTTRPDTLFGATFLVLAPDHPLVGEIVANKQKTIVSAYQNETSVKRKILKQVQNDGKEKTGVFTGAYAINPINNEETPIWIADYVSMDYGTGAIMAVPAHDERDFEFARKYQLEIKKVIDEKEYFVQVDKNVIDLKKLETEYPYIRQVMFDKYTLMARNLGLLKRALDSVGVKGKVRIFGSGEKSQDWYKKETEKKFVVWQEDGTIINSSKFDGLHSAECGERIVMELCEKGVAKRSINYHLRDWVFSRQHYWGEPIPIVHCPSCAAKNEELRSKVKLSLNFRQDKVWERILNGVKTVESRALNPEEPDRYFGNVQAGDLILGVNKNNGQELILKIKKQKTYKALAEFFKDKETLAETFEEKFKSATELEVAYDKLSPNLSDKANKNGLVAWEFEIINEEVPLPEEELPLKLPMVKKYEPTDTGESPLAAMADWVTTKCPKCGGIAKRETDTMPNWAGSSWYFLRYIDPKNKEKFADADKLKYWLPVDFYNGGMEHTTLHLLYSRFWHKFLFDIGAVPTPEPYQKRVSHGMILASDGQKMSKSRGNVINPDSVVEDYGADALRVYEMFVGPYDQTVAWNMNGLIGVRRFLEKIYAFDKFIEADSKEVLALLHRTIQKVTEDIDQMRFNTAVSTMMIFMNKIQTDGCTGESFKKFLTLLCPFAPHLAEEILNRMRDNEGGRGMSREKETSITLKQWPEYDKNLITQESIEIPVQINGKVREKLQADPNISEEEIKQLAFKSEKIQKFLNGVEPKKIIYVKGRMLSIVI